jgi:hypothetical protein
MLGIKEIENNIELTANMGAPLKWTFGFCGLFLSANGFNFFVVDKENACYIML